MAAETDRLALPRAIDQQAGEAAPRQIGNAAQILDFFLRIEPAEAHHRRIAFVRGVFSVHEVRRKRAARKRQLNAFNARTVAVFRKIGEAFQRLFVNIQCDLVFRLARVIADLIVETGTQIIRRRGQHVLVRHRLLGAAAQNVSRLAPLVEPGLVVADLVF